jgi:hypothetical protein
MVEMVEEMEEEMVEMRDLQNKRFDPYYLLNLYFLSSG